MYHSIERRNMSMLPKEMNSFEIQMSSISIPGRNAADQLPKNSPDTV